MKWLVFPFCLRPVLLWLLQIQGGETVGREVKVEGMNVVGADVEVVMEDVEVVVHPCWVLSPR
jgi:hypothetical protein